MNSGSRPDQTIAAPRHVDQVATALVGGLGDYLARADTVGDVRPPRPVTMESQG